MATGTDSNSSLTADEVVAATAAPILEFGRGWMSSPDTAARGAELQLPPGFGFWVNGRAGAMGEVGPDVAASAIGFMAPEQVRSLWTARPEGLSALDAALAYANAGASWGRTVLSSMSDTDLLRLTELCDKVADAALPSSGALFAGWRGLARPGDPAGDATVAMNVLRELRGGAHLSAVHAVGLGPHGAIMSTDDPIRGGESWAQTFGWSGPHPEADHDRRAEAERMTGDICRPAYEALSGDERQEFVSLVGRARAAVDEQ